MMSRLKKRPKAAKTRLAARKARSAVYRTSFSSRYRPAPKQWLTLTEAPMPPPTAIQMKMFVKA